MKKTIITALLLGITITTTSVFAEREESEGSKQEGSIRATLMSVRAFGKSEDAPRPNLLRVNDDVAIPSAPEIGFVGPVAEKPETVRFTSIDRLKYRGAQLIKERINALDSNKKAIDMSKTLTTDQKSALSTLITTNITGLTTLKASIASSTDATSTKELVNSIYTTFRIYGIVVPQVRLEKRIFDLQNHSQKLSDTFIKVQAKIDEYKGKGRDVTVWQKSLDDAKILVANDMNTLVVNFQKVSALKPSDYGTTSKMIIEAVNKDIRNVAQDFNSIAKNLRKPKMLQGITASSTRPVMPSIPSSTSTPTSTSQTTVYTTAQVASHGTRNDCWIIVSGKVYSVSSYISMHPGGSSAIANFCGQDATTGFSTRGGTGTHSTSARSILGGFLVGTL
jgi:cytochrome b involved in lipid metabolism